MKNRTIIGIICMVLAVVITFAVAPLVNRLSSDTSTVIRLAEDIKQGAQITDHRYLTDEVTCTVYDNGVEIYVNYGDQPYTTGAVTVPAVGYTVGGAL